MAEHTESREPFWSGDAADWLRFAIIVGVFGLGVGSCDMLQQFGEAAKIAAECKK